MFHIPDVLIDEIFSYLTIETITYIYYPHIRNNIISYLPLQDKMLLCKQTYNEIEDKIVIKNKEKFYINIVKNNYSDLLNKYLQNENIEKWFHTKKYYYENSLFNNYISLLKYLTIKYNAFKCKNIIHNIINNTYFKKYKHKNKIYKNIIWK